MFKLKLHWNSDFKLYGIWRTFCKQSGVNITKLRVLKCTSAFIFKNTNIQIFAADMQKRVALSNQKPKNFLKKNTGPSLALPCDLVIYICLLSFLFTSHLVCFFSFYTTFKIFTRLSKCGSNHTFAASPDSLFLPPIETENVFTLY